MNSCDNEDLAVRIPLALPRIQVELTVTIPVVPVENVAEGSTEAKIV
jgi:hypothetical protein